MTHILNAYQESRYQWRREPKEDSPNQEKLTAYNPIPELSEYPTINQAIAEKRNKNPWRMEPKQGLMTTKKYEGTHHKFPPKETYANMMKRDDHITSQQWSRNPEKPNHSQNSIEKTQNSRDRRQTNQRRYIDRDDDCKEICRWHRKKL